VNSELARVDPSVSVCMDVHNTLVNSTVRLFGSDYIKDKYLPGLATDTVSLIQESSGMMPHATDRDGDGDSLDRSA
jgi:alkylation response protein AidB-like acyl-CoA dehydrogenase